MAEREQKIENKCMTLILGGITPIGNYYMDLSTKAQQGHTGPNKKYWRHDSKK